MNYRIVPRMRCVQIVCLCLHLFISSMKSELYDIISNGPGSVLYDMPVNNNVAWNIGDDANFTLPINIAVVGKVTYVKNFMQNASSQSTKLQNIFIHGVVPAVPGISTRQGTFSASFYSDTVSANIQYPGGIQYELRPSGIQRSHIGMTKTYVMSKVNMTEKYYVKENMPDNMLRKLNAQMQHETTKTVDPHRNVRLEAGAVANLKVLVLYTAQAAAACGSESCMQATITLAIGNFNVALQNSNVAMTVDYVAERIQEYDTYVESADMGTMLGQLGSAISTARRNILNCHAVHLTTSNTQYCGIADYSFNGLTSGYSASFFGCIGGYHSLAHEVGHNIGLHHDSSGYGGGGPNRGYCWDDAAGISNCHRSIMAYGGCVTPRGKTNCDRVKYFSTPLITEMGNPVGVAGQSDNAQQLRNNIFNFMAQFTPSFTPLTPVGAPSLQPITPTAKPSFLPTIQPSAKPITPTVQPSVQPSAKPITPSIQPSVQPSAKPITPSVQPSVQTSAKPITPSIQPSIQLSVKPITPSVQPSIQPSAKPIKPTVPPSAEPSAQPTTRPTVQSTTNPTTKPSSQPSTLPTPQPVLSPNVQPILSPTPSPTTKAPLRTDSPTESPVVVAVLNLGSNTTTGLLSLEYTIIVASLSCLVLLAIVAVCYLRPLQKKKDLNYQPDGGISASQGMVGYDIKDIYRVMSSRKQGSNKHYSTNVDDAENGVSTSGASPNDHMVMQRNRAFSRSGVLFRKDTSRIDSGLGPHIENEPFGMSVEDDYDEDNEDEDDDGDDENNALNDEDEYSNDEDISITESDCDDDMLVTARKLDSPPNSGHKSARSIKSPASAVSVKSLIKAFEKNAIGGKIMASFGLSSKTLNKE